MNVEQFEEWLDEHAEEALARIEIDEAPLDTWVRLFGKALTAESNVYKGDDEDVDDDVDDDDIDDEPFASDDED